MSSNKSPKTYLFVDGSNLYGSQYELVGPYKYLDFSQFIDNLEKSLKITFNKIYFYASYSPTPKKPTDKQLLYLKNEQYFYRSVLETKKTIFFKGYRSPTSGKEKEVDVKLAVDMVDLAYRNKFTKMAIISGDADFIRALEKVDKLKLSVTVICMPNNIMYRALIHYPTKVIVIDNKKSNINTYNIHNKPEYLAMSSTLITKNIK